MKSKKAALHGGQPSRLSIIREKGETGIPKIPKRGQYTIPINRIVEDPRNERKTYRGIDQLIETIKSIGIIEPPTVVPIEDDRYMLTTGHRRFRAAKEVGLVEIPVIIGDAEEERVRRQKSIISNVQRQDVDPIEVAEGLIALKEDDPTLKTNRDVARVIGKFEQWVGEMLKILHLPKEMKNKISAAPTKVPFDAAVQVARLSNPQSQREILKDILTGVPVKEIRERAKQLKEGTTSRKRNRLKNTLDPLNSNHRIETEFATITLEFKEKEPTKESVRTALEEALATIQSAA